VRSSLRNPANKQKQPEWDGYLTDASQYKKRELPPKSRITLSRSPQYTSFRRPISNTNIGQKSHVDGQACASSVFSALETFDFPASPEAARALPAEPKSILWQLPDRHPALVYQPEVHFSMADSATKMDVVPPTNPNWDGFALDSWVNEFVACSEGPEYPIGEWVRPLR
jgi:hypothetical protein